MGFGTTGFGTASFGTADSTEFSLVGAAALSPNSVQLTFDAVVANLPVATDPSSYTIVPTLTVLLVVLGGSQVVLYTSTQEPGQSYTVTVSEFVVGAGGEQLDGDTAIFEGAAGPGRSPIGTLSAKSRIIGILRV